MNVTRVSVDYLEYSSLSKLNETILQILKSREKTVAELSKAS